MSLAGGNGEQAVGFYTDLGFVPFAIGRLTPQQYFVVKVCFPIEYNSQPSNRQEVQAGDVPSFSKVSFKEEDQPTFQEKPEVKSQVELARRLQADGQIKESIQRYRQAVDLDPNDPIALNDLAWVLTTAPQYEIRNGDEAVRFATKALELSHATQPEIIGTLAAAYAETGQFSKAVEMANIARHLAVVTGQDTVAAKNARLISLYSAGLTADRLAEP